MALPTLETPSFFTRIPSTGKEIKFRPFLVKEEKILLIAMQDGSEKVIINAVKEIIDNCLFKEVDVNKLTIYDIEYIFLQIRIKSRGNLSDVAFQCKNEIEEIDEKTGETIKRDCGNLIELQLDLETAEIVGLEKRKDNKIIIDSDKNIGVVMKEPTLSSIENIFDVIKKESVETAYDTISSYVDYIFFGEKIYDDYTDEEFNDFINSLPSDKYRSITEYLSEQPKLQLKTTIKCDACGHEEEVILEGLRSFLA